MASRRSTPAELQAYRRELSESKNRTTLEGLFRLARLLNEAAIERLRRRTGNDRIRSAHTALLPHLSLEGTRSTVLAHKLGVTKQAIGQLLDELEADGIVERVPDPVDGRAKLVRFSAKGRAGLLTGLSLLRELESELEDHVGARRWKEFRGTILQLLALAENERGE